jgi:hypothetical protein
MKIKIIENVHRVVCELSLMSGEEMCGMEWKEMDCIQRRFCKKVLKIPRFAAIGAAGLGMGEDSRKGRLSLTVKSDSVFCR